MLFIKSEEVIQEPRPESTKWKVKLVERDKGFYEPTVYILKEYKTGYYYIGSRTAKNCKDTDIGISYFTNSKYIKTLWKSDISLFEVCFIYKCESNRAALWYENFLINSFNAVKDSNFINKSNGSEKFSISGQTHSEEVRKKIGAAHKGKILTEIQKKKISESNTGKVRSEESKSRQSKTVTGENNHFHGKTHSEETKKIMSEHKKDKPLSESHRENMKISKLGDKNHMYGITHSEATREKMSQKWKMLPMLKCPFCGKESKSVGNMNRYHFEKCKLKTN